MMLAYCGDSPGSDRIESAIQDVIATGIKTLDLGGSTGTREFGEAVLHMLQR
jgi:methanogen homoisocitrate dehydrogenase